MSRSIFIPNIGDQLTLAEDWTFQLYPEYRNIKFAEKLGFYDETQPYDRRWAPTNVMSVTIPAGACLFVDRIYIRKGHTDFSSVTFRLKKDTTQWGTARFWAKLDDVNRVLVQPNEV